MSDIVLARSRIKGFVPDILDINTITDKDLVKKKKEAFDDMLSLWKKKKKKKRKKERKKADVNILDSSSSVNRDLVSPNVELLRRQPDKLLIYTGSLLLFCQCFSVIVCCRL